MTLVENSWLCLWWWLRRGCQLILEASSVAPWRKLQVIPALTHLSSDAHTKSNDARLPDHPNPSKHCLRAARYLDVISQLTSRKIRGQSKKRVKNNWRWDCQLGVLQVEFLSNNKNVLHRRQCSDIQGVKDLSTKNTYCFYPRTQYILPAWDPRNLHGGPRQTFLRLSLRAINSIK